MSAYPPPKENLPIYNPRDFEYENFPLTINDAKEFFLEYPTAQGEETLSSIIVNGASTFNDVATINDSLDIIQPTTTLNALNIKNDEPGYSIRAEQKTGAGGVLLISASSSTGKSNVLTQQGDCEIAGGITNTTGALTLVPRNPLGIGQGIRLVYNSTEMYGSVDIKDGGPGTSSPGQLVFPDGSIQTTASTAGGGETLAQTLVLGNSAGATDLDMNTQSIINATNITTGTLNYTTLNPPIVSGGETLAQTLLLGNSAGATDLDMNNQDITNATDITATGAITCGTLNYTTLSPPIPSATNYTYTQQVIHTAGSGVAQTITPPANCAKCDVMTYGAGGSAGQSTFWGSYVVNGGSGGGASMVGAFGVPVIGGTTIQLIWTTGAGAETKAYLNLTPANTLGSAYNGGDGQAGLSAGSGLKGTGATNSVPTSVYPNITFLGKDGEDGGSLAYPNTSLPAGGTSPAQGGGQDVIGWESGGAGMGQKYSEMTGGGGPVYSASPYIATGSVKITWYIAL